MTRTEQGKQNKQAYDLKYAKEHYKRVPLNLTNETYIQVKAAAEKSGESVNGYIKTAVEQRMQRESD